MIAGIAPELGPEQVAVPGDAAEGESEQAFTESPAIERGGIDEVHAQVEGRANRAQGVVEVDAAELLPEGGGTKAEDGELESRLSQESLFHELFLLPEVRPP
jgi:hypothetical protein